MAYFFPSIIQKRLLRYALSRLDFIDSDELDLDNLGLSLGQRSIVELKNVGIKVKRLVDVLQLPPSVSLSHASIKLLRLTVPADLHISGIEVEVDGVEIVLGVRSDPATSQAKGASGPSKTDRANLPRISPPDGSSESGRRHHGGRHGRLLEISQVIPAAEDLAASFLESEPAGEREELQAAIESQSHYMYESAASAAGDDVGLGMPGGLSLPSFVANFFKGVGDRLSVNIANVNVVLEMDSQAVTGDLPKFLLTIGNIILRPLATPATDQPDVDTRRSITVNEIYFFVLSEAEAFSDSSGFNSPRMARSRLRLSHPSSRSDGSGVQGSGSDLDQHSGSYRGSPPPLASPGLGIGFAESALEDSMLFDPPSPGSSGTATPPFRSSPKSSHSVDNRAHAEEVAEEAAASGQQVEASPQAMPPEVEDLSESRMFTHDDAESMYMSAVSTGMPGGWGWETATEQPRSLQDEQGSPQPVEAVEAEPESESITAKSVGEPSIEHTLSDEEPGVSSGDSIIDNHVGSLLRAQLLYLDSLNLAIPTEENFAQQSVPPSVSSLYSPEIGQSHFASAASIHQRPSRTRGGDESRLLDRSTLAHHKLSEPSNSLLSVNVGSIALNMDIMLCKLLIRAAQVLVVAFPSTRKAASKPPPSPSRLALPEIRVERVDLHFCECVPRRAPSKPGISTESAISSDEALFRFSMYPIQLTSTSGPITSQRLSISKVVMTHGAREVFSCTDSINVRDSIATSSILRPNDIVATMNGNRYDVQIKPVHIVLDLLVIDDVLSRSGGLSTLLDLGNSIASTSTAKGQSSPVVDPSRLRTVRFHDPQRRPRAESDPTSPAPKIDLRISGTVVDLIGSESSIQIKSSAIKAVYRDSSVKVAIDGAAIEGPLLAKSRSRGEIFAKIRNIQVHFSDAPDDNDLDRLLSLITPSSNKYEQDDDIMVDTLLRQRRKGSVLRLTVGDFQAGAKGVAWLPYVTKIADEVSKLSAVTKYLPEDDRPGILIFGLITKFDFRFDLDQEFGSLRLKAELIEAANISVPSLAAAQVATWSLSRSDSDVLIGEVTSQSNTIMGPPMFMCRFIADEMEPTVRMKVSNTCIEYKVPTIVDFTSLVERLETTAKGQAQRSAPSSPQSSTSVDNISLARKIKFSLAIRDSAIALNPDEKPSKGLFVLTDASIRHETQKHGTLETVEIKKGSILIINDSSAVGHELGNVDHKLYFEENDQVQQLTKAGFVPVGSISSASAVVRIEENQNTHQTQVDVEFRNNLLFLETCADSTQTLIQVLSGLAPPAPPSKVARFRTEVSELVPVEDMMMSFTGNAYVAEQGPDFGLQASTRSGMNISTASSDGDDDDDDNDVEEDEDDSGFAMYRDPDDADDEMTASYVSDAAQSTASGSVHVAPVGPVAVSSIDDTESMSQSMMAHSLLDFRTDHFAPKTTVGGTAHRWDTRENTYGLASEAIFDRSPLKVRVRDVHIIWNLFDGYDWQTTRDTISQAVRDIEAKAAARRPRSTSRPGTGGEEDDESVIGDFLFNSIYIGIPASKDPRELTAAINHDIDDMVSETGSYATSTTVTATPSRRQSGIPRPKKLKLNRSKHHKMAFELEGVSADFVAFPPKSGEVESSVDVRIRKLEVFDHVPTSTWKKFATYMQDAGEREVDTNQLHIELLNVKPVMDLAASELVLKISVLPLRLHIDQDALDFLTRFFEFKDDGDSGPKGTSNPPFIQRVEVNPIQLKLDFKPKRVDYAGLRSGRTTEFMNFFVLDRADMLLRRVILYGVTGFDRLGLMLNDIWSPDVKRNQLPTVLSGLAPLRPLVDVTSGVRELIAVPIREYKKDGRIVRSIQKGAFAFAKTTTTELVNLGAKMAIGTQQILQNTEDLLVARDVQDETDEDGEKKQISLYADQPLGIVQGLRGAYASLERDLLLARDAIIAVPGEIRASGSAAGAAKAVLKQSPVIILRPAIGASKAVGQTLLGAGNTLDRKNLRRIDEKYKRH